jgi:threonine dehydratase
MSFPFALVLVLNQTSMEYVVGAMTAVVCVMQVAPVKSNDGSGVSANIVVRDLLGLDCEIVGVVAENAPAYALSYEAGHVVSTESADTFVDGVACRVPDPDAVERVIAGCARIVRISEADAAKAMVLMYRATHNLAEPAGSLALAAVLAERDQVAGRKVAMILTGGNCDLDVLEAAARR